jgi:hypothetical protein
MSESIDMNLPLPNPRVDEIYVALRKVEREAQFAVYGEEYIHSGFIELNDPETWNSGPANFDSYEEMVGWFEASVTAAKEFHIKAGKAVMSYYQLFEGEIYENAVVEDMNRSYSTVSVTS